MEIELIKFGRVKVAELSSLVQEYQRRLQGLCKVTFQEIKNIEKVDEVISRATKHFICLDETGVMLSSPKLAAHMTEWEDTQALKKVTFFVGPPYGFSEVALKKSMFVWSLSQATFPSDIAWLLVHEQIYRAVTIRKKIPYHHAD